MITARVTQLWFRSLQAASEAPARPGFKPTVDHQAGRPQAAERRSDDPPRDRRRRSESEKRQEDRGDSSVWEEERLRVALVQ
eukprot:527750-Hanusia_phi.AAC.1